MDHSLEPGHQLLLGRDHLQGRSCEAIRIGLGAETSQSAPKSLSMRISWERVKRYGADQQLTEQRSRLTGRRKAGTVAVY